MAEFQWARSTTACPWSSPRSLGNWLDPDQYRTQPASRDDAARDGGRPDVASRIGGCQLLCGTTGRSSSCPSRAPMGRPRLPLGARGPRRVVLSPRPAAAARRHREPGLPSARGREARTLVEITVARKRLGGDARRPGPVDAILQGERPAGRVAAGYPQDSADAGSTCPSRPHRGDPDSARDQRDEVLAALARVDRPRYGQCVDCGSEIPEGRLESASRRRPLRRLPGQVASARACDPA